MRVWLLLGLTLTCATVYGQFLPPYIADYSVTIDLHRDSTLTVTETIIVNFGEVKRHGIYRKIPYRYRRSVRGVSLAYNLRLRLVSVTDAAGNRLQVKMWREGRYVVWRIGDPNRTVKGVQVYRITYTVARAINTFPDHDELYWNVTGNEWEWDIGKATCVVNLPEGVDNRRVRFTFYTGYYGSREQRGQAWLEGQRIVFTTKYLPKGTGLTIVLGLPKGVLNLPSPIQQAFWWLSDNWGIPVGIFLPLLTFAVLFGRYWRYGRDPVWREALVVQYRPPDDLTPAEVGVLLDERADNMDIVATVVDLAVKGYLKIREVTTTKWLFLRDTDYEFVFLRSDEPPKTHEQLVWNGLRLGIGNASGSARLSELRERFYPYLQQAKTALYMTLSRQGYFAGNPETIRQKYLVAGILLFVLSVLVGGYALFLDPVSGLVLMSGGGLSGVLCAAFAPAMPRKTRKGARALWHLLGFREFILRVEQDRLERMLQEDPLLFDRILPYALVFGIADEWAQKFDGLLQRPPDWYESPAWTPSTFNTRLFASRLGDSITTMNTALPVAPRSQSTGAGGGFSGFGGFSSGGFSGGGFGGGGGGGW
ncbi:MAG: hypothetical protein IMHGJWDQ_000522 [Candidatus Fervidibacter sp.]